MILANELTAILDKKSGQDVVNIMQKLAKEQGRIMLSITHIHCKKSNKKPAGAG
jgi:putative ABC transport system ATP-binding protein